MNPPSLLYKWVGLLLMCFSALLQACAGSSGWSSSGPDPSIKNTNFKLIEKSNAAELLSKDDLALIEESANPVYRLGSGDVLKLDVFGRPEVSGTHVMVRTARSRSRSPAMSF